MTPPRSSAAARPLRVSFPLWLKLGLTYGVMVTVIIASVGWVGLQRSSAQAGAERRERLLRVVALLALQLDGDAIGAMRRKADMDSEGYVATRRTLRRWREANGLRWSGIYRREGERRFYVADSEDEDALPINYPLFERWPALESAFDGATTYGERLEDEWGVWDSAFAPIRRADGAIVGVVGIDIDAAWRAALQRSTLHDLGLQLAWVALGILLCSVLFARMTAGHLRTLAGAAREVASGELGVHVDIRTRDEVGVVASAFNEMVGGLQQRDFIRDAFGRYVTPDVAERVLADPKALEPGGSLRTVTILMSDLRGFTSLSQQLTPAEMVGLLNDYLGRMSDIVVAHQGTIIEFIGDAIMVVFGAPVQRPDDPIRAVRCAAEMQIELERFNHERADGRWPPLEMGVGVHTGEAIVGNIGSATRTKYGLVGDDVNLAGRIESYTVGGEVLLSEATCQAVAADSDATAGPRLDVRGPIDVRPKGVKEPLRMFALRRVLGPPELVVPSEGAAPEALPSVSGRVLWWPISGTKSVEGEALEGRVLGLDTRAALVLLGQPVMPLQNLKLRVHVDGDDEAFEDVYAKVVSVRASDEGVTARLRLTSVPFRDRGRLAALDGGAGAG